ncbi:MAG: dTDP-4-dehydrorhamnose reductase [Chitinispirillaceae bacterium]|nr:dTDP-4-dehydrorhamnose reductase [Chitinispirillaceae bacterium]
MKLLVVGHNGMLGQEMVRAARRAGHEVSGADFPDIDITRQESIQSCFAAERPRAVVNCAAYTAVDACETDRERAFAVNARGAGLVAAAAEGCGAAFVHFSTDYVFDGRKSSPYVESDPVNPASVYGRSKLEGELLARKNCGRSFILRIAWLYGIDGGNFVRTIRTLAEKNAAAGRPLRVVNDQTGSPTYTADVCRQTLRMLETRYFGLYHCTSEGQCSWYDFALEIVGASGIPVNVEPCTTAEYPRPAPRPAYSVLENSALKKLGLNFMPHWKEAFAAFLRDGQHGSMR